MGKMKELSMIIANQTDPIHRRLLEAQKDIIKLRDAAYTDHRMMQKIYDEMVKQRKLIARLTKRIHVLETDT